MEEENQVFGKNAEAVDNNQNLESEDFNFYHQNKEEAKSNIYSSSKELTDFIDSLIQDIPDPSEDEVTAGIEKILERTHPDETKDKVSRSNKSKKVTFRVLFIAALLSILSFSCIFVIGNNRDISIENGFVTFAKDTIKIVFLSESEDEYITVDALLTDLEQHGYNDILFPEEFVTHSDEYKVSVPEYLDGELRQVRFNIYDEIDTYAFSICEGDEAEPREYLDIKNAKTIIVDDICFYSFEYEEELMSTDFFKDQYKYCIKSKNTYSEMVNIIRTIKNKDIYL